MATLDHIRAVMPKAYKEALRLYKEKGDVEGALIFFSTAIGLLEGEITEEDIHWSREAIENYRRLWDGLYKDPQK